jgi:cyclophilin family peptidyl-prolyl cis-trans isomerase
MMEVKGGPVMIELRPDLAPKHVERIRALSERGFYDGAPFHRVIPGFMAQTGDPTGTGSGGSDLPDLKAEFSNEAHVRGTVSMARTANPNSANSQFFICFGNAPWLDRQYTVWGKVTSGMEHVDAIKKGGEHNNGAISGQPDKIIKMRIIANS